MARRVLIVEDTPDTAELREMMLRLMGYEKEQRGMVQTRRIRVCPPEGKCPSNHHTDVHYYAACVRVLFAV